MPTKFNWHSPDESGSWLFMFAHLAVTGLLWLALFVGGIALLARLNAGPVGGLLWIAVMVAWTWRANEPVENPDGTSSWRGFYR